MVEYFSNLTQSSFGSPQKFWDFYKKVVKTKKSSDKNKILCVKDQLGVQKYRAADIADVLNKHFASIKLDDTKPLGESYRYIDNLFNELKTINEIKVVPDSFTLNHTSAEEVINIINDLSTSGSPGVSGVPVSILKTSASFLASPLSKMFNACINFSVFPNEWKCAIVTPLF